MSKQTAGVRFGTGSSARAFSFDQEYTAIFDSGTSIVYIPATLFDAFMSNLVEGTSLEYNEVWEDKALKLRKTFCDTFHKWPRVALLVNGWWLTMEAKDYFIYPEDQEKGVTRQECAIGFTSVSEPYFLLGDVFFRGYYVIHDDKKGKLGFAVQAGTYKP